MKSPLPGSQSVWMDEAPAPATQPLAKSENADVCIVGAGITGLTAGYLLAKSGKRVIVLDDGSVASGETGRTTAHLSCMLGSRYTWLESVHGADFVRIIVQSHQTAIDTIEQIVHDEKIDCQFSRVPGYLFLHSEEKEETLEDEREVLINAGMKDVTLIPDFALGESDPVLALRVPNQGQFHAMRYIKGLARAFQERGGQLHTSTHVHDLKYEKERWTVFTDANHNVHCTAVILATNAPVKDNVQIYGKQAPYRTFAITGLIPKGSLEKALFWDTQDPYHYVRTLEKDAKQDFVIIGGEDYKTGQENDAPLRFQRLEQWARSRFPQMGDIVHRWSGQVMESYDGIAMIGHLPGGEENLYIATGDSGNGLTHGTIAGLLLTDVINGTSNPWKDLYDPSRIRLKATKELLVENANVATEMTKEWFASHDAHALQPNSGMVVEHEKKKIALYRDTDGAMHACSAVCPHKGCIVQWNSFEKSWDCPCHGSRFEATGEVLNGPTIENLEPMSAAIFTKNQSGG